jgi:hypothetical protein
MSQQQFELVCRDQKIAFIYDERVKGYTFGIYLRDGEGWKAVSEQDNSLVKGTSFNLYPQKMEYASEGLKLLVSGVKEGVTGEGGAFEYKWSGELSINPHNGWIRVQLNLSSDEDIMLQMSDGYEPEIILNMGELPPYDRGDHVWYKINIDNPTKWNDEAHANDFPALYYFNAYSKYDVMMYFDMTAMDWMSRRNIARFLGYKCGFRRRYQPKAAYELGLYAHSYSGKRFPKGVQRFDYYIQARHKEESPTEQTALQELVDNCLNLVEPESRWPQNATCWEDFAVGCAVDLMDDEGCWSRGNREYEYMISYVNGFSPAWSEALTAKGVKVDFKGAPGFDTAVMIGYSLMSAVIASGKEEFEKLSKRIHTFIQHAIEERIEASAHKRKAGNKAHREKSAAAGTWQFTFILEQLWQFAYLNEDDRVLGYVMDEVHRYLIPLAQNTAYLFPLCFNKNTCFKIGAGDNYAVGGLYASFMFTLYRTSQNPEYLAEARRAINALLNAPINSLPQESFLIAIGVQASALLYEETQDPLYMQAYDYLLAQNKRMLYWYDDNTMPEYQDYNVYGMFQGCTPMFYPAFLENIECVGRIASTFTLKKPHEGLLLMFNHARKNNFYYFPQCLPEKYHISHLNFIPLENLGVLEAERSTGTVGQEIYGCGQTFRAYLTWEAYGRCLDRDVMVLNLNGYREYEQGRNKNEVLDFIVFNPEAEEKRVTLEFPTIQNPGAQVLMGTEYGDVQWRMQVVNKLVSVNLKPRECYYLQISI